MSAALRLIAARADDDSPVATWAAGEGDLLVMAEDRARALADETRDALAVAGANLVELRAGNAHLALGFDHWFEFVETWFGDLTVYRLVKDREQRIAERDALIASMTLAGYTVRDQRDSLGASLGTIHGAQRRLGLVPDKPLPTLVEDEPEPVDPFRSLRPIDESLARVGAQGSRGLTSTELAQETSWPAGTPTGSLSRLAKRGLVVLGALEDQRANRRPYTLTERGAARLAEVLTARDAAEQAD